MWSARLVLYTSLHTTHNRVQRLSLNAWGLKVRSLSGVLCRRGDTSSAQKWRVAPSNDVRQTALFDRGLVLLVNQLIKGRRSSWVIGTLGVSMEMRENKARLDLGENLIFAFNDTPTPTQLTPRVTRIKVRFSKAESMFTVPLQTVLLSLAIRVPLAMQASAKGTSSLENVFHLKYNAT